MFKVLVSDEIAESGINILKEKVDVTYNPDLSREKFLEIIENYDGIIVRSMTKLDKKALNKAQNLKVIGRAGTGYDNIDVEEATKKGIHVFNTPTGNTISAVEHTMGLMLALSRNIVQANNALHEGIWDRKKYMGTELNNKKLGIIGLGKIGSRVALRAQAFNMEVIANDPYLAPEKAQKINVPLVSKEEIYQECDYITIHTPLTEETKYMLDKEEFQLMKKNAKVINCSRGGTINTEALAGAIEDEEINGAAIDVHEKEPINPEDNPLVDYKDRVIMTCHLGGTTTEAMDNVSIGAAKQVLDVLINDSLPKSPLNIPAMDPQELNKLEPYLNLTKKLGKFMTQWIKNKRIREVEIEYGGSIKDKNSDPFTITSLKALLDPILDSRVNMVNAQVIAEERGINVKESYFKAPEGLENIIRLNLKTESENYSVAGTSLPIGPRMIEINDYRIDQNLEGKQLVISYEDKPGVIGKIGSILGEYNINISRMQVGSTSIGKEAIMLLQTDSKPSTETLNEIDNMSEELGLIEISYLEL